MPKVETEKSKPKDIWNTAMELPSQWIGGILRICSVLLLGCMFFDVLPFCNDFLERMFTYNLGNVIAIIVVIWTFTVSLSTYCLEKLGRYYFGIRMFNVLLFDLKWKGIIELAGLVLTELFSLVISAIAEWEITIVMIAIQQFFIMIYIFIMVITKTSSDNVSRQIYLEIEGILKKDLIELAKQTESDRQRESNVEVNDGRIKRLNQAMLIKMTRGLDYADNNARENLLKIVENISDIMITGLKDYSSESNLLEIKRYINTVSYQITSDILRTGKTREDIMDFLYRWIAMENMAFEIKQGIVMALLENLTPQNISIYQGLIRAEMEHQRELKICSAVYNVHMQKSSEGEEWRSVYIERQFEELYPNWKQEDAKVAMDYWKQIHNEKGEYGALFRYIFPSQRLEVL